jgi:hypothetical protein
MSFFVFFIFNGLSAIENGGTSMCRGNSELIRVSLRKTCGKQAYLVEFATFQRSVLETANRASHF